MSIVDARAAGEGNLEILVQVGDQSLPTDVQPLGNAIFGVSFDADNDSPRGQNESLEEREFATKEELSKENQQQEPHIIYITFNDDNVPGNHNNHNINDAVNSIKHLLS